MKKIRAITADDIDDLVAGLTMPQIRRLARAIEGGGAFQFYECRGFAMTLVYLLERFKKQHPELKKVKPGILLQILGVTFMDGLALGSAAEQFRNWALRTPGK